MTTRPYTAPSAELYADLNAVNSHYRAHARKDYHKSLTGCILAGLAVVAFLLS